MRDSIEASSEPGWGRNSLDDGGRDGVRASSGGEPTEVVIARRVRRAVGWSAGAGFLLGIVFWHFVGFWSFVGSIVLRGPESARERPRLERYVLVETEARARGTRPVATWPGSTGSIGSTRPTSSEVTPPHGSGANSCTALALDRGGGRVAAIACSGRHLELDRAGLAGKGDREQPMAPTGTAAAWQAIIAPGPVDAGSR